jgi:hypothetical protein
MPAVGEESVANSHTHFAPAGPQGLAGALFLWESLFRGRSSSSAAPAPQKNPTGE